MEAKSQPARRVPRSGWRVRPEQAHKTHAANLWLETASTVAGDGIRCTYQFPYGQEGIRYVDLMEVQRQAGIVFAHKQLQVRSDAVFVLSSIALERDAREDLTIGSTGTVEVFSDSSNGESQKRRHASLSFRLFDKAVEYANGSAHVSFLPPGVYERFRSVSAPDQCELLTVSQGPEALTPNWIDLAEPIVTDHDYDHVPAMAIVSAIERTVTSQRPAHILEMLSIKFDKYIEPAAPALLDVDWRAQAVFEGTVLQGDAVASAFRGRVSPLCEKDGGFVP